MITGLARIDGNCRSWWNPGCTKNGVVQNRTRNGPFGTVRSKNSLLSRLCGLYDNKEYEQIASIRHFSFTEDRSDICTDFVLIPKRARVEVVP